MGADPATRHFIERAKERMGCTVGEATAIASGVIWALDNDRRDLLRFVARISRQGLRMFRFRHTPTGQTWYVLIDTNTRQCVTVMPPGYKVRRHKRSTIVLKEGDI